MELKCTGVHAAVLAEEGSVAIVDWKKPLEEQDFLACNGDLVSSFDPNRDVLLFPSADSILADDFFYSAISNNTKQECFRSDADIANPAKSEGYNRIQSNVNPKDLNLPLPIADEGITNLGEKDEIELRSRGINNKPY